MPGISVSPVTGSAFTQARYKIKPEFFCDLLKFLDEPYEYCNKKLWKGHVLVAGDGSTVHLPPSRDIEAYFGVHSITNLGVKRYLAQTLLLYDVLNNFVIDGQISTMKTGEKTLLRQVLSKVNDTDILILDRGFGHFCTIRELVDENKQFCIRMSVDHSNFAKRAIENERNDFTVDWEPTRTEMRNSATNHLNNAPVRVRVVKVKLESGETEILVTNLDNQQKYTGQDIKELYILRWGVEEGFKNLKPKMKIEQFGCRKATGVFQEFYAHIFCMNMVALTGNIANSIVEAKTCHRKWKYKHNWKNAYRFVREKLMPFLFQTDITQLLERLIQQIASSIIAIKPDRHFTRDMRANKRKGVMITQFNK